MMAFAIIAQEVAHFENHPLELFTATSPKTKKSLAGFRAATKRKSTEGESSCGDAKKLKCLTNLDLAEFIRERGIKSYTELLAIAGERRTAGQMDIAEFVFKRNKKYTVKLIPKLGKWSQPKKN